MAAAAAPATCQHRAAAMLAGPGTRMHADRKVPPVRAWAGSRAGRRPDSRIAQPGENRAGRRGGGGRPAAIAADAYRDAGPGGANGQALIDRLCGEDATPERDQFWPSRWSGGAEGILVIAQIGLVRNQAASFW